MSIGQSGHRPRLWLGQVRLRALWSVLEGYVGKDTPSMSSECLQSYPRHLSYLAAVCHGVLLPRDFASPSVDSEGQIARRPRDSIPRLQFSALGVCGPPLFAVEGSPLGH
jgi:hypothetical protein